MPRSRPQPAPQTECLHGHGPFGSHPSRRVVHCPFHRPGNGISGRVTGLAKGHAAGKLQSWAGFQPPSCVPRGHWSFCDRPALPHPDSPSKLGQRPPWHWLMGTVRCKYHTQHMGSAPSLCLERQTHTPDTGPGPAPLSLPGSEAQAGSVPPRPGLGSYLQSLSNPTKGGTRGVYCEPCR